MKKFTAIPKKLYYFFLILILFFAAVVFVLSLIHLRVKNNHAAELQLLSVKERIEILNALHYQLLASVLYGMHEEQSTFENADKEMNSIIRTFTGSTVQLSRNKALRRRNEVKDPMEAFSRAMDDFSSANSIVMASIKERGNIFEGTIAAWIKQAGEIEIPAEGANQDLLLGLEKIKALQSQYILTSNNNVMDVMNNLVITLQGQLPEDDMVNAGKFDTLLQLNAQIIALNNRLGLSTYQGELPAYNESYSRVQTTFDNLMVVVKKNLKRSTSSGYFMGSAIILLLLLGFLFFFYWLYEKSITRPIHGVRKFAAELSKGVLPENPLNINPSDDTGGISEELNLLAGGLKAKTQFARDLNQGHFETEIKLLSDKDDLGAEMKKLKNNIISSAEEQVRHNEENAKRRYINEGLAKFGNILRLNSGNLTNLGDSFIRELVRYLNAIQGGFFILDESEKEKPVLRLAAAFAYNRKKYLEKTILMGEGLVGTCAIEKKTIHLTEMPAGYILITSGLGDAPPDNLLLIPVLHEDELIGVLEIASLNKFNEHEITFTEEVAGNLGSTIVTTRVNQKTSELLSKSQQQAMEMAEQEEEMRQNMEELKATQEESARREEEFRGVVNSLNQSVFLIEYDLDGTIITINEKFLIFLNKMGEELIGKTHAHIFGTGSVVDSKFWNQLNNLSNTTIMEKVRVGKKAYLVKEHFSLVTNSDGLPVKVLNIITEIPEKPVLKQ